MLLTIIAYFALLLCGLCVWAAFRHAERAHDSAQELRNSRGRIIAAEGSLESLNLQLQRLRGQFHAFKTAIEDGPAQLFEPRETYAADPIATHNLVPKAPFCENYGRAQVEGPRSPAASCECGYCVEMRERRRLTKEALLPKGAAAQARHAKEAAGRE